MLDMLHRYGVPIPLAFMAVYVVVLYLFHLYCSSLVDDVIRRYPGDFTSFGNWSFPKKTHCLPEAVWRRHWRISVIYIGGFFVIGGIFGALVNMAIVYDW